MKRLKTVLIIAGSDPSAGAGIQADLKTVSALGLYGLTAITSLTVQNTLGVKNTFSVSPEYFREQLSALADDIIIDAVKIGMLHNKTTTEGLIDFLKEYRLTNIVLDPVLVSSSGRTLLEADAIDLLKKELFPLCTLITPNIPEAELLCGMDINSDNDLNTCAGRLIDAGVRNVLIKGGHSDSGICCDYLFDSKHKPAGIFCNVRIDSQNTHGTGCTLSSAIAACMAGGMHVRDAVFHANSYLHRGIEEHKDVILGRGIGPLKHDNSYCKEIKQIFSSIDDESV